MEILTVDNFLDVGKRKKRRRRLGKACLNCRKRKIKCDQIRPRCTSCKRKFIIDCTYEDQYFSDHQNISTSSELRKEEDSQKNNIDKDSVKGTKFEALEIKSRRIVYHGLTSKYPILMRNSITSEYTSKVREYLKGDRREWKKRKQVNSLLAFDYTHTERLIEYLPNFEFMKDLLNRYFKSIWYSYMPIIDKGIIMDDYSRIFVLKNNKLKLRLNGGQDYSTLSLLLIIMKYMIQVDNKASTKYPIFLSSNDIFLNLIEGIRPRDGNFMKRSTLPALQAILLQRIFKKFNIRDGDNGDHSNGSIMFTICFRMAMSMGLHRDIDMLYHSKSIAYRGCLKEIWKCLLYYDTWNSLDIGIPLQIQDGFFDNNILKDTSDSKVNLILMLRSCCNRLSKFEVFEDDIKHCIYNIKQYLGKNEPLFNCINVLNTTHEIPTVLAKISNLISAISLLQHLNNILAVYHKENSELHKYYDKISTKYSFLSVTSVSAMIKILRNRLKEDDQNASIHEGYIYGIGISLCYSSRSVFALMIKLCENSKDNITTVNNKIKISDIANYDDDPISINSISNEFENSIVLNSILMQLLECMFTDNEDINVYCYYIIFCCIKVFNKFMLRGNENGVESLRVIIDYSGCARVDALSGEMPSYEEYDILKDDLYLSTESAHEVTKLFEELFGESPVI